MRLTSHVVVSMTKERFNGVFFGSPMHRDDEGATDGLRFRAGGAAPLRSAAAAPSHVHEGFCQCLSGVGHLSAGGVSHDLRSTVSRLLGLSKAESPKSNRYRQADRRAVRDELRKFSSQSAPIVLEDGRPNPLHCSASPACNHHWFYDFRVNRRRYRNTTETATKQEAKNSRRRSAFEFSRDGTRFASSRTSLSRHLRIPTSRITRRGTSGALSAIATS